MKAKNLLILHAHDMGRYNRVYGHALPTPKLMDFARSAVVFRDAHCAAPTCSPSRAAMLTGRTAHEVGMLGLLHRGFALTNPALHLAKRLSKQGYYTVQAGLQHEYNPETQPVYDQVLEGDAGETIRDLASAEAAAGFLAEKKEQPWFMWMGLFYPHREFIKPDPERFDPDSVKVPDPLPDTPANRKDVAAYAATVEIADQAFGRVLDALEQSGQAENTVVVVTTDHGIPFPEMKCALTSHGTGVTFMVRDPERPSVGVSDALVSHLDMVPTVFDCLGLDVPDDTHGYSLLPVLENPGEVSVREDLFAEVNVHAGFEPKRSVRTRSHLLIRIFKHDLAPVMANCDESPSKTTWLDRGWPGRNRDRVQVYDLTFDPQERHNVAEDPAYAEVRKELEGRLLRWMEQTNDPLLAGPLRLKSGIQICAEGTFDPHDHIETLQEERVMQ